MAKINFGGVWEEVVTSEEFPLSRAQEVLKGETVAVLGYGVQGPGQALNLRDNGIRVIVGQREGGATWKKAVEDGFVPGKTLFPVEEAAKRGTIIEYLLSDAGQKQMWPTLKPYLTKGKTLYFSHGFSITYREQTGVIPPRGHRRRPRRPQGFGTLASHQLPRRERTQLQLRDLPGRLGEGDREDPCPRHRHRLGIPLPDDLREGGVQRPDGRTRRPDGRAGGRHGGAVQRAPGKRPQPERGLQRNRGGADPEPHRLVAENGMDWMYLNCSTTALDWRRPFRDAVAPIFDKLYDSVRTDEETRIVLSVNNAPDYRKKLNAELETMNKTEMWQAGAAVRALRPENRKR